MQSTVAAASVPLGAFLCFPQEGKMCLLLCCCVLQVILQSGYVEDHLISNVKITLGLIA
jgi:hypothetical protein